MDTLTYYLDNRCIAVFRLKKEQGIRTLGSASSNDFVIKDNSAVAAIHFKMQFQSGVHQFYIISGQKMLQENVPIPCETWFSFPQDKKLWFSPFEENGYIVFRQDIIQRQIKERTRRRTQQMRQLDQGKRPLTETRRHYLQSIRSSGNLIQPEISGNLIENDGQASGNLIQPEISGNLIENDSQTFKLNQPESEQLLIPDISALAFAQKTEAVSGSTPTASRLDPVRKNASSPTLEPASQQLPEELDLAPDPELDRITMHDTSPIEAIEESFTGEEIAEEEASQQIIAKRYQVVDLLGKGGMGVVYKAVDQKLNREVALKLLLAQGAKSLVSTQRFLQEARAMARLHHENIVAVHDIGDHKGNPYFTMDLVAGQELQSINNIKPRQAMQWMLKICQALQYVHENGILHRDLKPSNIIISNQGPVLMDFGIAKDESSMSQLTADGQSLGTPSYMSPEQAQGLTNEIDERTDVYGLGAILYEMLTGQPPFFGPPMQVLYKVCATNPPEVQSVNPAVPKDVAVIVQKAMAKDKNFRYVSAQEMAGDIRRYLDGLRIHAQLMPWHIKMLQYLKRNRRLNYTICAGGVLLLILICLGFFINYRAGASKRERVDMLLKQATQKRSQLNQHSPINNYLEILELYTQALVIDNTNSLAQKGKFAMAIQMGDRALVMRDYPFAKAMYNSALQMGINLDLAERRLADVKTTQEREKKELVQKVEMTFRKLQQMTKE